MTQPLLLITGASRGIGEATAFKAAQVGWHVIINYKQSRDAAFALQQRIVSIGGRADCIQADVSSSEAVRAMFTKIEAEFGRLSGLVNNAGILEQQMPFTDTDFDRWQRVFNTNVLGPMLCSKAAYKHMSPKHGGSGGAIVNVSSLASVTGSPFEYVDYATSKGAIDTFTKGFAKEVASEGIRVNAVRPGFIDTDMHASGGEPDRLNRLAPSIPMQRGGTAEEVANAIIWLLSDEASYTSGTFLDVAGGR
ncbi:SDR family oxidoreductase [Marinomonas mediterranea]|uniref:SDR family oxidoreductase n=1 Tax=Marinomonas mediterranea TaxID=119864 RepID=UPI00234976CC|nr:SDR family oxidoreductase [Marinomonas mediterranea]WCN11664.1 SDR family oxidoreductase [Marinomonas mediterranea]